MAAKRRILVIGSANMDLVVKTDRIPAPGETVLGGTFYQLPGGKGANQACAAARLGGDVAFVGCVGDDSFGDRLRQGLIDDNVDCRSLRSVASTSSGVALIGVDAAGRNLIIVAPGANAMLTEDDVDRAFSVIDDIGVVVAQREVPVAVVAYALRKAAAMGISTILNPAPFHHRDMMERDLAECITCLVPNEHEAAAILSVSGDVALKSNVTDMAQKLLETGIGSVVITLGADGCIAADRASSSRIAACEVEAVDSTAAGDCFTGALAVAIVEGADLVSACRFATRAAAISVTRLGAQPSLPTRAELDQNVF